MTNEEAGKYLFAISMRIQAAKGAAARKRSWRQSEKAMTIMNYERELEAITVAQQALAPKA